MKFLVNVKVGCNSAAFAEHTPLMAPETLSTPTTEAEVFQRLYRAQAGAVLAYAFRRTDPDTAKDVVAETFLVVWQRLEAVPEDPLPWLLGVARNVLRNRQRSTRRQDALRAKIQEATTEFDGDAVAAEVNARLAIISALARIPEGDQQVLKLIAWDKLSISRAAVANGCSEGTFKVRLHRARKRLAKELNATDTERRRS